MKILHLLARAFSPLAAGLLIAAGAQAAPACQPTRPDMLGPFYQPGAPVRSSVGSGYLLSGTVKSARDCAPVAGARIEFWLAGPTGHYDADHRATVVADAGGRYRFESNVPPPYGNRPPHIHLRVTAEGFQTLVTQHYPNSVAPSATFDLVLLPQ